MRTVPLTSLVLLALVTFPVTPHAARVATIVDLGGIAGRANWAMDINNHGDVVGIGAFQSEQLAETRGLLWSRGTLITLPPLPGDVASHANAINNRRQVVGQSMDADMLSTPVLWEGGVVVELTPLPGQVAGEAYDINDRGDIAGTVMLYDRWLGEQRAVVWRHGVPQSLFPASVTWSSAMAINNRGQVVGQAFGTVMVREGNISRSVELTGGYLWDRGRIVSLGSLGGQNTIAYDINERGQVTGTSDNAAGDYHAYLWEAGRMRDLGTLTRGHSSGHGLNNKGEVVGQTDPGVGFLWRRGFMYPVGFQEWDFTRGEAINNAGDIVGLGFDDRGEKHAVIRTERGSRFETRWIEPGTYP